MREMREVTLEALKRICISHHHHGRRLTGLQKRLRKVATRDLDPGPVRRTFQKPEGFKPSSSRGMYIDSSIQLLSLSFWQGQSYPRVFNGLPICLEVIPVFNFNIGMAKFSCMRRSLSLIAKLVWTGGWSKGNLYVYRR